MNSVKIASALVIVLFVGHLRSENGLESRDYVNKEMGIFIPGEYFEAWKKQHEGNYEEAEKYYIKAGQRGDNRSYYTVGKLFEKLGNLDKAEQYFLLAAHGGLPQAECALARVYLKRNQMDLVEKYVSIAREKGLTRCLEEPQPDLEKPQLDLKKREADPEEPVLHTHFPESHLRIP